MSFTWRHNLRDAREDVMSAISGSRHQKAARVRKLGVDEEVGVSPADSETLSRNKRDST